jgi:hypothetical protein
VYPIPITYFQVRMGRAQYLFQAAVPLMSKYEYIAACFDCAQQTFEMGKSQSTHSSCVFFSCSHCLY